MRIFRTLSTRYLVVLVATVVAVAVGGAALAVAASRSGNLIGDIHIPACVARLEVGIEAKQVVEHLDLAITARP